MAYQHDGRRPSREGNSPSSREYARGRVVSGANGAGRDGYVPGTRAGKGENPRQSRLGSNGRGGKNARPVPNQHGQSRYRSERNYRTIAGHDTGYTLKGGRGGGRLGLSHRTHDLLGRYGISNRMLILLAAAIVLLILIILGVSSCVGSLSSKSDETQAQVNQWDPRVSINASEALTKKFTPSLDQADDLKALAQNLDSYANDRIPELALVDPASLAFVIGQPTAEKTASSYEDSVTAGTYPLFYAWDTRWGYVDFAGNILGVTGSGPTALSMAYMGLTGKNDQTPATIAETATTKEYATNEDPFVSDEFATGMASELGLTFREYTPSGDNLSIVLQSGPALVLLNADFTTPYQHWALVTAQNEDGSVTLYDPMSSVASSHVWSIGNVGASSSKLISLTYTAPADTDADTTSTD